VIDLGLTNKRAVVSGAGYIPGRAGHGRFSALKLAEAGAVVACIDIDQGRAHDIVTEIEAAGGQAFPVIADMNDQDQATKAVDEAVAGLGGIDICVDIIGQATYAASHEVTRNDWNWNIHVNLTQVFYLMQAAGRRMIEQGTGGSFVSLASVDGLAASSFHAAYGAAKAGVISLTKTFADEYGKYGIRVNAVAPGNVGSGNEDQPEGQWAVNNINPLAAPRGHDVANAVLFLSSTLGERITGQVIVVDGGVLARSNWGWDAPPGRVPERFSPDWVADPTAGA
jgi:NAD(P)-dependent dehydrogenase (short-subunit alcohol dehydrogenase family)